MWASQWPFAWIGLGASHVDGDEAVDPARLERIERRRVAADLLGHRQHVEAEPARLGAHQARVLGHRIEVEQVGAGRHPARLVQRDGRFEKRPVAVLQCFQEHRPSILPLAAAPAGPPRPAAGCVVACAADATLRVGGRHVDDT